MFFSPFLDVLIAREGLLAAHRALDGIVWMEKHWMTKMLGLQLWQII